VSECLLGVHCPEAREKLVGLAADCVHAAGDRVTAPHGPDLEANREDANANAEPADEKQNDNDNGEPLPDAF
jgi:hypothetical protein